LLPPFNYFRPVTLNEALSFLANEASRPVFILAGGTDLILEMRSGRLPQDSFIVDISFLEELRYLRTAKGNLEIGPLLSHGQISTSREILDFAPLLARACSEVGTPQVRARGTIGGNVVHASPAADSIPPLLLHDARVTLISLRSERTVPLISFLKDAYKSDLHEGELLWKITLSPLQDFSFGYQRLIPRQAVGIARLIVCVALKTKGQIEEACIAIGSATPVAFRARKAEAFLKGKEASPDNLDFAASLASEEMIEISGERWSTPYKRPVLQALTKRALLEALSGSRGNGEGEN